MDEVLRLLDVYEDRGFLNPIQEFYLIELERKIQLKKKHLGEVDDTTTQKE